MFHWWWLVSLAVLLLVAAGIGKSSGRGVLGIFIDTRGRYSLTHFQTVLWSIVILSSLFGVLAAAGFDFSGIEIPPELLGLMGISAGSAVLSTSVKGSKDLEKTKIACEGVTLDNGKTNTPRLAQIWLEEEGEGALKGVVSITKYQNFIFTLVILATYVSIAWRQNGLPELPQNVIWLIGISHAGYVGGKVPNKK